METCEGINSHQRLFYCRQESMDIMNRMNLLITELPNAWRGQAAKHFSTFLLEQQKDFELLCLELTELMEQIELLEIQKQAIQQSADSG